MSGQENQESFIDFSVIFFPLLVTPQPGLLRWFSYFNQPGHHLSADSNRFWFTYWRMLSLPCRSCYLVSYF